MAGSLLLELHRAEGDASRIGAKLPPKVIWIDLLDPTDEEKSSVERILGIKIPTEAALNEIEASSRLISRNDLLYLSSPAVRVDEHGEAHLTPVGFVLGPHVLVTIRFAASPVFDAVRDRVQANDELGNGIDVFVALLEAIVDRGADVLEHLASTSDGLSRRIFKGGLVRSRRPVRSSRRLREALENVGMMAEMKMTLTIQQSESSFDITSHANMQGQDYDTKTHYDLTGKPATNEAPMTGTSETVSKWDGAKLVTTWTSAGAVAGSKVVRTETRSLSADGKTMTVESVRGTNTPLIMIFEKKQ